MPHLETRLRVRYAECDPVGVAYHANYLVYFESGRDDMFRRIGVPVYNRLRIVETRIRHTGPLRFDEEFAVRTHVSGIGRTAFTTNYRIVPAGKSEPIGVGQPKDGQAQGNRPKPVTVAEGIVVLVHVGEGERPAPIPEPLRQGLARYEGEPIAFPSPSRSAAGP